jgi:hypothetical protein
MVTWKGKWQHRITAKKLEDGLEMQQLLIDHLD